MASTTRTSLWVSFGRLRRRRRVRNATTLGIVLLGPLLALATFLVLGPFDQGAAALSLRLVLLADLVYVLVVAALVLSQVARLVAAEHQLHGKTLRPGERVFAMLNAANMDPEVFEDPLRFDITRDAKRHVTFGYGTHFCIGAALARLEGEAAFPALVSRFPDARLSGEGEWHDTMIMRGLRRMPVVLG